MVAFNTYVEIGYEVARDKGVPVREPQRFMRELGAAYQRNNHSEATRQEARAFLEEAVN